MIALEDTGGGSASGAPSRRPGSWRDHRIGELRRRVEELRAAIADAQGERRRAILELNELLEEQRRLARRARQQQRAARIRRDDAAEPGAPDASGRAAAEPGASGARDCDSDPQSGGGEAAR